MHNFFNIDIIKIFLAANPHIRVISEGSCDTEDCWKFSFDHRNKLHFEIYYNRKRFF